jgi:hypothetical protein
VALQAGAGLFEAPVISSAAWTVTRPPAPTSSRLRWRPPLKQIAVNAGLERGVVAEKVRGLNPGEGLDAPTGPLYSRTGQSSKAGRPPACHQQAAVAIRSGVRSIWPARAADLWLVRDAIIAVPAIAETEEMTWSRSTVNRQRPSLD